MSNNKRSLAGIGGWLAVEVAIIYGRLLKFPINAVDLWHAFSDPLAQGPVVNDLLILIPIFIVQFGMLAVGFWMIHKRRPQTRLYFCLVAIPIDTILGFITFRIETAIAVATAGHHVGTALAQVRLDTSNSVFGSISSSSILITFMLVVTVVEWLYWWGSERVKQTFSGMTTGLTSSLGTEPDDTPQASIVLRVLLVDAILSLLVLGGYEVIRSKTFNNLPILLHAVSAVLWFGAIVFVFRDGILTVRTAVPFKFQFDVRWFASARRIAGILILLLLFSGGSHSEISFPAFLGLVLGLHYILLPQSRRPLSPVFAAVTYSMFMLFGIGFGMILPHWQRSSRGGKPTSGHTSGNVSSPFSSTTH